MCSTSKILNPASMMPGGKNPLVNPNAAITNRISVLNEKKKPTGSLLTPATGPATTPTILGA
jgi:hypothetical protein